MRHRTISWIAVAGLAAGVAVAPAAAAATPAKHHPTRHGNHQPSHHHGKPARAIVHGLIVHRDGDTLTVFAHTVKVGGRTLHNQVQTVVVSKVAPSAHAKLRTLEQGDRISARGTADNGSVTDATVESSTPQPAQAVFGTVQSVNGELVSLTPQDVVGGDNSQGDDNQGDDNQGDDNQGDALVTDVTAATFGGAATGPQDLTAGEYVLALGEQSDGSFVAADVIAYNSEPAFVVGQVTAADPTAQTLSIAADDSDSQGDDNGSDTAVDTSNALVVVNGAQDGSYPAVGDEAVAVGPDGSAGSSSSPLPATVVYDFNANDNGPADDNGDGGGGD